MLHIYYGNGKGKTTAAVGSVIRAAGRGFRVLFVQFLKSENSGERMILSKLENVTVMPCPETIPFTFEMTEKQRAQISKIICDVFDVAARTALTKKYDMLVLDEILCAIDENMLSKGDVYSFLSNAPRNIEIICTGRNAPKSFLKLSDYVSHIVKEKHPFDKGVESRIGIEY